MDKEARRPLIQYAGSALGVRGVTDPSVSRLLVSLGIVSHSPAHRALILTVGHGHLFRHRHAKSSIFPTRMPCAATVPPGQYQRSKMLHCLHTSKRMLNVGRDYGKPRSRLSSGRRRGNVLRELPFECGTRSCVRALSITDWR